MELRQRTSISGAKAPVCVSRLHWKARCCAAELSHRPAPRKKGAQGHKGRGPRQQRARGAPVLVVLEGYAVVLFSLATMLLACGGRKAAAGGTENKA